MKKLARFIGECYFDDTAKENVVKIKPTLFGRLFPRYTLIVIDDFNEKSTIRWM